MEAGSLQVADFFKPTKRSCKYLGIILQFKNKENNLQITNKYYIIQI